MKILKSLLWIGLIIGVFLFYLHITTKEYKTATEATAALIMGILFFIAFLGKPKLLAIATTVFWVLATILMVMNFDTLWKDVTSGEGVLIPLVGFCIWLWLLVRFVIKNILKKEGFQITSALGRGKAFELLFKNIIAPAVVSILVYYFTGQPTWTIVSVPIVGIISASINIG